MELIAHWPLEHDTANAVAGRPALVGAVEFTQPDPLDPSRGAVFATSGRGLRIPSEAVDGLGQDDFTLQARIWTHPTETAHGDVVSRFDPSSRTGFTLSLLDASGVTSSHSNRRTLSFGTDAGTTPTVHDHGQLGTAFFVYSLAVHDGSLFAGTVEGSEGRWGRVFRKTGDSAWEDCGSPDDSNAVTALVSWDGSLYAGTSFSRKVGSALPESVNQNPGGRVFRYVGGQEWEACGSIDPDNAFVVDRERNPFRSETCDSVGAMVVHKGRLYAVPAYSEGMFRYEGGTDWSPCGSPGFRLMSLHSDGDTIVCAANESGGVFLTDGEGTWTSAAPLPADVDQTYSFAVHDNALHIGTWPDGKVHRLDDGVWKDTGRLGEELEVMGMASFNGKFYGGTLPAADLYRLDAEATDPGWSWIANLDPTPDVKYRRAWSMAVYRGELHVGTLPSGHVRSIAAGAAVTSDETLSPGWHALTASRSGGELRIEVDGRVVATRDHATALDIDADTELVVGSGPTATFRGVISDVRIYRGASGR